MRAMNLALVTSSVWLAAMLGACTACEEEKVVAPSPKKAPTPKWKVDKALEKRLREIAASCKPASKRSVLDCEGGARRLLEQELLTDKIVRSQALETFLFLLEEKRGAVGSLAAAVLYNVTRSGLESGAAKGAVSPEVARGLIKQLSAAEPDLARQIAPATAHAAALADILPELDKAVAGNPKLSSAVYRFTMVYGRLSAFPKIKELVKGSQSAVRLAAVEAPRNMRKWTPKDRAEICPWAATLLQDERPMMASRSGLILSRCTGAHVDALLEHVEALVEAREFGRGHVPALRDLCSGMRRRAGGGATKEQCDRNRELLEELTEDSESGEQLRIQTLSAIAYQWPDEEARKLAKKLASQSKATRLQRQAEAVHLRLERRSSSQARDKITPSAVPGATPSSSN